MFDLINKLDEIKGSLKSIGDFCAQVSWIFQHPYESFKIIVEGLCIIAKVGGLMFCAAVILMYICGHDKLLKYVPTVICVYILLKVLVSVL